MIRKMLIANRGEIACRIITTCREMGIATVAIYADNDKNSRHVQLADEAVWLDGQTLEETYLNTYQIIEAAKRTHVDAIHPGYGLLAENPAFAYAVKGEQLVLIGPSPESIEVMTNKHIAKMILKHIHFLPSYVEDIQSDDVLIAAAEEIGFPIMVKPSAGSGGKGLVRVDKPENLPAALKSARQAAMEYFKDGMLTLEKCAIEPRHICVQVMGDHLGKIVTIGEQECTIRRHHQVLIAESPSAVIKPVLREQMSLRALDIAHQLGLYSAGTIEFLLDEDQNFYFIDMKPGLHVAHSVTELVYGLDLVRWQIQIARGVSLAELLPPFTNTGHFTYEPYGYAAQAHIYAEEPENDFSPATGEILHWESDEYTRTDYGIAVGNQITAAESNLLAKIIAHAETRLETIRQLDYALSQTKLLGVQSNIAYLRRILLQSDFLANIISADYLDETPTLTDSVSDISIRTFVAVAIAYAKQMSLQKSIIEIDHWGNKVQCTVDIIDTQATITIAEQPYHVEIWSTDNHSYRLGIKGHTQTFTIVGNKTIQWVHTTEGISVLECRLLES